MNVFRTLLLTGFLLILTGFLLLLLASLPPGGATGGGAIIVFIGPFPLMVGFGEYSPILMLVSVVIVAVMILITLMSIKYTRKQEDDLESGEKV